MLWIIYFGALLLIGKEEKALIKDRCWKELAVISALIFTALLLIIFKTFNLTAPLMWLSDLIKKGIELIIRP